MKRGTGPRRGRARHVLALAFVALGAGVVARAQTPVDPASGGRPDSLASDTRADSLVAAPHDSPGSATPVDSIASTRPDALAAPVDSTAHVAPAPPPVPALPAGTFGDPGCSTEILVLRAGAVTYPLSAGFIRPGTDQVRTSTAVWANGSDYVLDRTRGVLRLLREPVAGETLRVTTCRLIAPPPLEFQRLTYRRAENTFAAADTSDTSATMRPRPVTARIPSEAPVGTALTLNGNKTIAVDFGSRQDAFLRQSLDLAVSGTLGPGIEITGVLTDRNTPITTEGETRDLQSLDRVLIELRAPGAVGQLGDVELNATGTEFGRLERRVQGVRAAFQRGGTSVEGAAASAQGEYRRLEFFGTEGRQGPYPLTGLDGTTQVAVVAGSEIVYLDGARLSRGESADYSIDYERGEITFTNKRPVSSASRITVEFQATLEDFHRNLATVSAGRVAGPWRVGAAFVTENDDRGRPITQPLDASDQLALEQAGDSLAVGGGVSAGTGDYDLIQSASGPYYAFAGTDSGAYVVRFAIVGAGHGDYAESTTVAQRIVYRHVGAGLGSFAIGRRLPSPESHQLATVIGGFAHGPFSVSLEGAVSRLDANTFSTLDDQDNAGRALDARVRLDGSRPTGWIANLGIEGRARDVNDRFSPFTRLEAPFVEEDWGLPAGADLTHQKRVEGNAWLRPRAGGEARASVARLETPDGFQSVKTSLGWVREGGVVRTVARWDRADGTQSGLAHPDGGRDHALAELGAHFHWFEPAVRAEWDERSAPSDTGWIGGRDREVSAELRGPGWAAWHTRLGAALRRDATRDSLGFHDEGEAITGRVDLESPATHAVTVTTSVQRRERRDLDTGSRTRSDLASVLVRGTDFAHGLAGRAQSEVTTEGENLRERVVHFVGTGLGAYDSLGNFVGTGGGAYDLGILAGNGLGQIARAASSAQFTWTFGTSEAWRGSRLEFVFESEARRRGDLHATDLVLAPDAATGDTALARASVTQRIEATLAPGATAGDVRLRLERRVNADRSFANFGQTTDERTATARWRARGVGAWSTEVETRWRRREAMQSLGFGTPYQRTLLDAGGTGQLVYTSGPRLRAAAVTDLTWSRPENATFAGAGTTRTILVGPDLGVGVLRQGRLELTGRRSFVSGAPALSLLPTADPAEAPRWQGTLRFDLRVIESTSAGITFSALEWKGRPSQVTGRAEVRAFF